jgi:hypothetical protein
MNSGFPTEVERIEISVGGDGRWSADLVDLPVTGEGPTPFSALEDAARQARLFYAAEKRRKAVRLG